MNKFLREFFSMRMMALGLIVFLFAIAVATFLESIYNIQTAKLIIYNAVWFELLLVYLGISLIVNIFRYQMWKREKIAMLMFHLSFIVILIGAGITRYISFEGIMKLPEPDPQTGILRPVDFIYSSVSICVSMCLDNILPRIHEFLQIIVVRSFATDSTNYCV